MSTARLHLKQPAGWFAAGREVACALTLLSDMAFKLFVWMCLHAERSAGSLRASPVAMGRSLGKSEDQITAALNELLHKGVCEQIDDSMIEITDRFWPYERLPRENALGSLPTYLGRVKKVFLQRCCVRSAFTAADEKLVTELFRKGVPIENVERAILLGSLRKYVTLLNHGKGTPITTLHYFTGLLDEIDRMEISANYWEYVARKLAALELRWHRSTPSDAPNALTETK